VVRFVRIDWTQQVALKHRHEILIFERIKQVRVNLVELGPDQQHI
jgi:hypothetical protein